MPPPPREVQERSSDPRIERLQLRIAALEKEIETVERSGDPDSPYQQRLNILASALDVIEDDIAAATPLPARALPALPATPITNINVRLEPAPEVSFEIGSQHFRFAEEIDWAERGTQIVHGDLIWEETSANSLVPLDLPNGLQVELAEHLERSLFAFATEVRDRAIEGQPFPIGVTLTDLAIPSNECGDWELWGGVSIRCLEHATHLRALNTERTRLLDERSTVIEERQRQVEELPIQRRRLNQAIADLQKIESEG